MTMDVTQRAVTEAPIAIIRDPSSLKIFLHAKCYSLYLIRGRIHTSHVVSVDMLLDFF
jgi:hypothetical protein